MCYSHGARLVYAYLWVDGKKCSTPMWKHPVYHSFICDEAGTARHSGIRIKAPQGLFHKSYFSSGKTIPPIPHKPPTRMKRFVAILSLVPHCCSIGPIVNPTYNKSAGRFAGADDYGMKMYVLVLLKTGSNATASKGNR